MATLTSSFPSSTTLAQPTSPEDYESYHVHSVYDTIATHFSSTRYKPWPVIDSFLKSLPSGSIGVDVGCGNGKYMSVRNDIAILGSDRSENLITIARNTHLDQGAHDLFVANTLNLPHGDASVDFAICIAVIHHLSTRERRVAAIREVIRLLREDSATRGAEDQGVQSSHGQALFFVWALEQSSSRRGWDKGMAQDVLVPWVLKEPSPSKSSQQATSSSSQKQHRRLHAKKDTSHASSQPNLTQSSDRNCPPSSPVSNLLTCFKANANSDPTSLHVDANSPSIGNAKIIDHASAPEGADSGNLYQDPLHIISTARQGRDSGGDDLHATVGKRVFAEGSRGDEVAAANTCLSQHESLFDASPHGDGRRNVRTRDMVVKQTDAVDSGRSSGHVVDMIPDKDAVRVTTSFNSGAVGEVREDNRAIWTRTQNDRLVDGNPLRFDVVSDEDLEDVGLPANVDGEHASTSVDIEVDVTTATCNDLETESEVAKLTSEPSNNRLARLGDCAEPAKTYVLPDPSSQSNSHNDRDSQTHTQPSPSISIVASEDHHVHSDRDVPLTAEAVRAPVDSGRQRGGEAQLVSGKSVSVSAVRSAIPPLLPTRSRCKSPAKDAEPEGNSIQVRGQSQNQTQIEDMDTLPKFEARSAPKERVFQRFYHLYASGELISECVEAGATIVSSGFDRDNWWVVVEPGS